MKFVTLAVAVIAVAIACAAPAQQQKSKAPVSPAVTVQLDSVDFHASPELQKSLEQLAASVRALAVQVATDPQLRAAALQVASGAVVTAQQILNEQSVTIQEALKTAAQRINEIEAARRPLTRKP
jgi:hypothetical protein